MMQFPALVFFFCARVLRLAAVRPSAVVMQSGNSGQPPDLDEVWRDFNRKVNGLFGRKSGGSGGEGEPPAPDMSGKVILLGLAAVVLVWLSSGFFMVQEGQRGVVLRFGKHHSTVGSGLSWRLPYPIDRHEVLDVTQLRSTEIGRGNTDSNSGLLDSYMLTEDENIVDVRFTVQYNLKNPMDYLFNNVDPDLAVEMAAESAVREVVGGVSMDTVLYKDRESIQQAIARNIQTQLDKYESGIEVQNVNISNVQPPERVQAAFNDAIEAGQDRERSRNLGLAYANNVIPKAKGKAVRMKEDALAYKARTVAEAKGQASRFEAVLSEYQDAPKVTRDRLYLDAMRNVYGRSSKVLVDGDGKGSNMLYLPIDKLMERRSAASAGSAATGAAASSDAGVTAASGGAAAASSESVQQSRRDSARSRSRNR